MLLELSVYSPGKSCHTYTTGTWISEGTSLPLAEFSLDSGVFPALTSAACCMTSWTAWNTIQIIHIAVTYVRVSWVLNLEPMNNYLK